MMLRFFYTGLLLLLAPFMLLRLWWRGRREPGYRAHIGERFGEFRQAKLQGAIWIHAVSAGEMRAAGSLIAAMKSEFPNQPLLLTCMTATGRDVAEKEFLGIATISFLPYDFPWAMQALIRHFSPSALLIMETELWPNMLASCRDANIPAHLINARLSERSRAGYARFAPVRALTREALAGLRLVAAQSDDDAARLASLGATNVTVTGNLKFDVTPSAALVARGAAWRAGVESRKVLVAASTRDGEEALIIAAYRQLDAAARAATLLVIVPRHPQRFDAVHTLIANAGFYVARRTDSAAIADNCEVWLGDSMNEMFAYLAMADVVFIGGSLVPVGGQNLIEACALGKPVIMGPSTFNFTEATEGARKIGAMIAVESAEAMIAAALTLLNDTVRRDAMAASARQFAAAHRGTTEKTMAALALTLKH